jgi:stage V sporulation protein B
MIPCIYFVFKLTKTKPPTKSVVKILSATAIMGIVGLLIPKNTILLFPGIIICMIVYFFALILVRFFTKEDIETLRGYSSKLGPLSKFVNKLLSFVEKIEFRNK